MKNFLLMLLGVLMTLPTFARDFTYTYEGQTLTYTVVSETDKTCMTKAGGLEFNSYYGYETYFPGNDVTGELVIPSKASDGENDFTIISIGDYAFSNCYALTSAKIPDSVTSIGDYAFSNCYALTSIKIPDSVTSIGYEAFDGCSHLKKAEFESIEALCRISFATNRSNPLDYAHHLYVNGDEITELVIPTSVTSIGDNIFTGCSDLTSVSIPASVTSIGNWAFGGCSGLEKAEFESIEALFSISFTGNSSNPLFYAQHLYIDGMEITELVIPDSVTSIGDWAFGGCSGLTSVTIPDSVTSIGDHAFWCTGLTSVTIPGSVTSIGEDAFLGCDGLTSVTIPGSVTSMSSGIFSYCSNLTLVTISDGVTSIGNSAFYECTGLTSVTIPGSVTSIGNGAFKYCVGLTSVTIPASVTSIGDDALYGCTGLTSVYYGADSPIIAKANVFSAVTYGKATLYMSAKGVAMGRMIVPWKNFNNIELYDFSGVEEIEADINPDKPYEVYNLKGAKVGDSTDVLTPGLYIIRQGNATKKAVIK